ncbi:hypothetical protein, partial [uncultured Desulfovibrio sp.]|uniref:hypothetical protein n=1 Tax=uncultured Desulfovibrio sp. TaxID=167968 RepID=UPI002609F125
KVSGKTAFFPRNDRPYGLERAAFQTKNALRFGRLPPACGTDVRNVKAGKRKSRLEDYLQPAFGVSFAGRDERI